MYRDLDFLRMSSARTRARAAAGDQRGALRLPGVPAEARSWRTYRRRALLNSMRRVPRRDPPLRERAAARRGRCAGEVDGVTADERRLIADADMISRAARSIHSSAHDLARLARWDASLSIGACGNQRRARLMFAPQWLVSRAAEPFDVKHRSRALTEGPERAAARAYLHGIGYSAEDLAKPIVASPNVDRTMPCNFDNRCWRRR